MKSKKIISVSSIVLAVLMIAAALSGCSGASSALKDTKEKATKVISDYNSKFNSTQLDFANEAFAKGENAAKAFKPGLSDAELEKIAKDNGLTSITVSDAKGNIVACYPKDAEKLGLKQGDWAWIETPFGKIRPVVVGFDSADYAKVSGINLADECGDNTVVIKDDKVISSNIDGIELDKTLEDIGISKDDLKKDSFTFKAGDKSYNAVATTSGGLTAICASPA